MLCILYNIPLILRSWRQCLINYLMFKDRLNRQDGHLLRRFDRERLCCTQATSKHQEQRSMSELHDKYIATGSLDLSLSNITFLPRQSWFTFLLWQSRFTFLPWQSCFTFLPLHLCFTFLALHSCYTFHQLHSCFTFPPHRSWLEISQPSARNIDFS